MNKKGASKGKVLIIALECEPTIPLTDKQGFMLCFDTYKQIADYSRENGINLDDILVDELDMVAFDVKPNSQKRFEDV